MCSASSIAWSARSWACAAAILVVAGCSASQRVEADRPAMPSYAPLGSDVLALRDATGDGLAPEDDALAWEAARLDAALGAAGSPIESSLSVAEIRHREYLRTTNGKPRNDSYTYSRSYQRRVGP